MCAWGGGGESRKGSRALHPQCCPQHSVDREDALLQKTCSQEVVDSLDCSKSCCAEAALRNVFLHFQNAFLHFRNAFLQFRNAFRHFQNAFTHFQKKMRFRISKMQYLVSGNLLVKLTS